MRESFRKSFDAALRHRDLIGRLADVFASKKQYDSLAKRVAKLEQMLQGSPKNAAQTDQKPDSTLPAFVPDHFEPAMR
jgi:hypothetical protein